MLFTKLKEKLYKKAYPVGINLVFIAGLFTWGFRPAVFYHQEEGVLIDAFDTISNQGDSPILSKRNYSNVPVYLFYINDNVYRIEHPKKENKIMLFEDCINKRIYFRYKIAIYSFHTLNELFSYNKNTNKFIWRYTNKKRKIILEIICDEKVIYRNDHLAAFFICFAIFIINLIWCLWAFVKHVQEPDTKHKLKDGDEEHFLENCKIRKIRNKYLLYYVSQLDRAIKAIEITEEEFLSTKNGNKTLEDFRSTYNLW